MEEPEKEPQENARTGSFALKFFVFFLFVQVVGTISHIEQNVTHQGDTPLWIILFSIGASLVGMWMLKWRIIYEATAPPKKSKGNKDQARTDRKK